MGLWILRDFSSVVFVGIDEFIDLNWFGELLESLFGGGWVVREWSWGGVFGVCKSNLWMRGSPIFLCSKRVLFA